MKRAPQTYKRHRSGRAETNLPAGPLTPEAQLGRDWHTPGRLLDLVGRDAALLEVLGPEVLEEWLRLGRGARLNTRVWVHAVFSLYVRRSIRLVRAAVPGRREAEVRGYIEIGPPSATIPVGGARVWRLSHEATNMLRLRNLIPPHHETGARIERAHPASRVHYLKAKRAFKVDRDLPHLQLAEQSARLPWGIDVELIDHKPIVAYEIPDEGYLVKERR